MTYIILDKIWSTQVISKIAIAITYLALGLNTSMTFILATAKGAPVELESLTISRDKETKDVVYFETVDLKNTGLKAISEYRIGWRITDADDSLSTTVSGPPIALKAALLPGGHVTITRLPLTITRTRENNTVPSRVYFFVAAVTFTDSTSWKAETKQLSFERCVSFRYND